MAFERARCCHSVRASPPALREPLQWGSRARHADAAARVFAEVGGVAARPVPGRLVAAARELCGRCAAAARPLPSAPLRRGPETRSSATSPFCLTHNFPRRAGALRGPGPAAHPWGARRRAAGQETGLRETCRCGCVLRETVTEPEDQGCRDTKTGWDSLLLCGCGATLPPAHDEAVTACLPQRASACRPSGSAGYLGNHVLASPPVFPCILRA